MLRGPQGTLFGAGAEGGAVRFLTPSPDFENSSLYAPHAKLASIRNGGTTYEAGIAGGTPLSDSRRDSRRHLVPARRRLHRPLRPDIHDPSRQEHQPGRQLLRQAGARLEAHSTALAITPSVYYQKVESDGRPQYWQAQFSDVDDGDFRTASSTSEPSTDKFTLPALKIEYDLGGIDLISNTSYFHREREQVLDYSTFLSTLRARQPVRHLRQQGCVECLRPADARTEATSFRRCACSRPARTSASTGAPALFFSRTDQDSLNPLGVGPHPRRHLERLPAVPRSLQPVRPHRSDGQAVRRCSRSLDFKVTSQLTATRGSARLAQRVRVRRNARRSGERRHAARSTPPNRKHVVHAARGRHLSHRWRQHGVRLGLQGLPSGRRAGAGRSEFLCIGSRDAGPHAEPARLRLRLAVELPRLGSKNRLLGGALTLDANVYYIQWKNIQQSIRLPTCSFAFISNLGEATGKGADLSIVTRPLDAAAARREPSATTRRSTTTQITGGNGLHPQGRGRSHRRPEVDRQRVRSRRSAGHRDDAGLPAPRLLVPERGHSAESRPRSATTRASRPCRARTRCRCVSA